MYQFNITVDKTKVQGTHTNYVYLFNELATSIPSGFWSHVANINGLDIRFFDGTTELKREVAYFNSGTQKVECWVQVPSGVSSSANKTITCRYGGANRANDTAVWTDVGYKAVYHLQNNGADSVGLNSGSVHGSPATVDGQIEKGESFDGVNDYYDCGNDASIQLSTTGTLQAWVKAPSSGSYRVILDNSDFNAGTNGYSFAIFSSYRSHKLGVWVDDGSGYIFANSNSDVDDDTWHYCVGRFDGANLQTFVDGEADGSPTAQSRNPISGVHNLLLGAGYPSYRCNATLDEVRVNNTALSSDWIKTEFNNHKNPATFSSCGTEVSVGVFEFPITIDKTKVPGPLTNWPYLFSELTSSIPAGFWGHVADPNGLDIRFFDGAIELNREIVYWNVLTQKIEAWINIPAINNITNKVITCRYGGATRANDTALWTAAGILSVFHFQGNALDSSASGNNGSVDPSVTPGTGKINTDYNFTGAGGITLAAPQTIGNFVGLRCWIKYNGPTSYGRVIEIVGPGGNDQVCIIVDYPSVFHCGFSMWSTSGGPWFEVESATLINDGKWHYVLGVGDSTGTARLFVDGLPEGTPFAVPILEHWDNGHTYLGKNPFGQNFLGDIDEVGIFAISRTSAEWANWAAMDFASQNNPATFASCGAETLVGEFEFSITIDKTKVPGPLTNWPYLFSELTSSIPAGFWGHVADPNGLDIRFFDGAIELNREIVYWNVLTQKIEAWINIPAINNITNKVITCRYGGATRANDTAGWVAANAKTIYHFQDAIIPAHDSAGIQDGIFNTWTQPAAKLNKGAGTTGIDHITNVNGQTNDHEDLTVATWVYSTGASSRCVLNTAGYNWAIVIMNDADGAFGPNPGWGFRSYTGSWAGLCSNQSFASQSNSWHHIVITKHWNGAYWDTALYVDGQLKDSSTTQIIGHTAPYDWEIGGLYLRHDYDMSGVLDEFEIYTDVKDANWVAAEFNNQNDPTTFSSCGSESSSTAKTIKALVVAGGGAGGTYCGGGGGAGGVTENFYYVIPGDYAVIVGNGGAKPTGNSTGANGQDSAFNNISTKGGGGGAGYPIAPGNGGSGGGAYGGGSAYGIPGGTGLNGQGFRGGASGLSGGPAAGGGGGASHVGFDAVVDTGGTGGGGTQSSISGVATYYGGGGGGWTNGGTGALGGLGGGGAGSGIGGGPQATDASANSGGGGGGGWYQPFGYLGGAGGSGVVIVRYKTSDFGTCIGGVITTDGEYTVHTFNSNGTWTYVSSTPSGYKFPITIDKTKVYGTNTKFPYLFTETTSSIPSGFWGHAINKSGIKFFDTDGVTELKREIVKFDAVAHKIEAWVQVLSLTSSSDKKIWCQYGGSMRSNDTEVWSDLGLQGVYHFQGNANDSSINGKNGVVIGATQINGKIEKAYYFNGSSDINIPVPPTLGTQVAYSCWMRSSNTGDIKTLISKEINDDPWSQLNLEFDAVAAGQPANVLSFNIYGCGANLGIVSATAVNDGAWHHIIAKRDGSDLTLYLDNVLCGTVSDSGNNTDYDAGFLDFGSQVNGGYWQLTGDMEEVRIYTGSIVSSLNLDWEKTEYSSQNDPATFASCGAEEPVGPSGAVGTGSMINGILFTINKILFKNATA